MKRRVVLIAALLAAVSSAAVAKDRAPLPDTAFDGGVISAETLGRGGTTASNRGTAASGSENPAALHGRKEEGSSYTTVLVDTRSDLDDSAVDATDPLNGKVLQYFAVAADKGVIFFEPISRLRQSQIVDATAGTSRDVELSANAIGFAGGDAFKGGSIGLSVAYVWSSLNVTERAGGNITEVNHGTSDGLRLNLGLRYPTGPAMWGISVQNAPGFLWGGDYRRSQLPLKVKAGTTYRVGKGVLFTLEGEQRFYHEGGERENFIYAGTENFLGKYVVLRFGAFGTSLNASEDRHLTAGATIIARSGTAISYAIESFELDNERIKRSIVSVNLPFVTDAE